ncbi:MAG: hypothetical protein EP297_03450 [Gammaproteobacteria bacterium]|nr:MAG: hypothetical protein EP297_03450 [Gammaproteobacteria bacterium]
MPAILRNILFFVGYISLVGPPRAIELKAYADRKQDELAGKPLYIVMLVEFILRGGLILLLAVTIESLLGDQQYELYRLDIFLGALIVSGACHSCAYYLAFGVLRKKRRSNRVYRFGRNFSYAVIPAFFSAGIVLAWQNFNQKIPFEGGLVEKAFIITWAVFLLAGLIEATIAKRQPTGLGDKLHDNEN